MNRVKCRHCGEMGHGSEKMCDPEKKAAFQAAKAEEDSKDNDGNGGNFDSANAGGDFGGCSEWKTDAPAQEFSSGPSGWESQQEPIAVSGGDGW